MKKCYLVVIGIIAMIVIIATYLYFGQKTISTNRKWESTCTRPGMKELIDSCKKLNDSIDIKN